MAILCCISDHGFGHAARSIPLLQALQKKHKIVVRNLSAAESIARELPQATLFRERNDIGVLHKKNEYAIDHDATREAIATWLSAWDADVERITQLIREHDIQLVISDSAPQPLLAAHAAGIPGIFFGSFTWLDVYDRLGLLEPKEKALLSRAYASANCGIILPFHSPCESVKPQHYVKLIASPASERIARIPNSLLFTVGGSLHGTAPWRAQDFTGTIVLAPEIEYEPCDRIVRIAQDELVRDYLPAVDALIGKSGYGIVSEAIRSQTPLFLSERPGFIDDEIVIGTLERLGIGKRIAHEDLPKLITDELFTETEMMRKHYKNLPELYTGDGIAQAVKIIEEFL